MAAADLHKEEDSSLNFFEIEQPTPVPDGQNRDGAVVFQTVDDAALRAEQSRWSVLGGSSLLSPRCARLCL
jgi:hypothetical protein